MTIDTIMRHSYTSADVFHVMRYLALALLFVPLSLCYAEPTTPGSVLTFYITDENLVTDHRGVMTVSTDGLVDFTINGTPISGPSDMVETGIDTGVFQLELTLPSSVNGNPLQDGDVVLLTYHQRADYSGHPQTITQSVVLNSIPSSVPNSIPGYQQSNSGAQSSDQSANIGQYFTLQVYAPNYNLDSQVPDDIPLSLVQVNMQGVSTTLADPAFDIGTGSLRETGANTDTFAATFKIPRSIDGFPVEIGSTLEFTFGDNSQPVPSESSIFVRIGTHYQSAAPTVAPPSNAPDVRNVVIQTTSTTGTRVDFLNFTVLQGLVGPDCFPSSGSLFPIGTTTVTCSATNQDGNSVLRSFSVTLHQENILIPSWVKNLTGFWCSGNIQDSDFKAALQFLDSNKIISIPESQGQSLSVDKSGICAWSEGNTTGSDIAQLFYPLLR